MKLLLEVKRTGIRGASYGTDTTHKTGQLTKIVDNQDHNRDKLYEFDALGRIRNAKAGTSAGATGVTATGVDQNSATMPADGLTSLSVSTSTNRVTSTDWEY